MAHHPEKFLDGRMLWRGRIYSPLPFVRSLWGTRINAGVWGTAAFPSVYRTDVHPFAFLPHSIRWQVLSFVLALAGARDRVDARSTTGRRTLLLGDRRRRPRGRRSRRTSPTRWRSDVDSLPRQHAVVPRDRRLPAFHSAARAHPRTHPRRAVAAGSAAAVGAAADQPRPAAVARAKSWRALLLHQRHGHRRSLLERDAGRRPIACSSQLTDWLRRSRAVRHDRNRRRLVRRSRRQRVRRPMGVARRARAGRRARRRQVAAARQHAPASDDASASSARSAWRRRCWSAAVYGFASTAHGRRARHVAARRRFTAIATLLLVVLGVVADGAGDGDSAARHPQGRRRQRHGRDAVRPGARAAHRAVAAAALRPAQRDASSS